MEDVDEPGMLVRDLFVALDPLELAFEGPLVFEILTTHHLHRAIHAGDGAGQIDLTVGSPADAGEDLEVRMFWR